MPILGFDAIDQLRAYADSNQNKLDNLAIPPEQHHAFAKAFRERFRNHPLLQQYIKHISDQTPAKRARNTLPWHAAGEHIYARALVASAGMPDTGVHMDPHWLQEHAAPVQMPEDGAGCYLSLIWEGAALYLWSEAMVTTCAESPPLPPHTVSRSILPYPLMFFSQEVAYRNIGLNFENNWIVLSDTGNGIQMFADHKPLDKEEIMISFGYIPYGTKFPDDLPGAAEVHATEFILKKLAFINSPYINLTPQRLARPWRRGGPQRNPTAATEQYDPEIRVVTLRRTSERTGESTEEQASREYKHQWWVAGHYRAQWYPSEKAHKVIYIAPHLQGPADKPILEKIYRVER